MAGGSKVMDYSPARNCIVLMVLNYSAFHAEFSVKKEADQSLMGLSVDLEFCFFGNFLFSS